MKAEDMPPYRPTPERLMELEATCKQLETMLLTLAPEVPKLTARIVELERSLKEHRDWHVFDEQRIAKLEQAQEANASLIGGWIANHNERVAKLESLVAELMDAMERLGVPRYPNVTPHNKALIARNRQHQALADAYEGNTEQEAAEEV